MFLSPSWRDEGITTPRQQPEVLYALALGMTRRTREQLAGLLDSWPRLPPPTHIAIVGLNRDASLTQPGSTRRGQTNGAFKFAAAPLSVGDCLLGGHSSVAGEGCFARVGSGPQRALAAGRGVLPPNSLCRRYLYEIWTIQGKFLPFEDSCGVRNTAELRLRNDDQGLVGR